MQRFTQPPAVSIVIATYNYGRYLHQAICSVLGQTWADWEVIVVDDGSTDDTPQVMLPYLSDPRVRYERTDHVGQSRAKNHGIRVARAPLVAFLDADDAWLPAKLERQLRLFEADPELGVAYTRRLLMDAQGRMLECPQPALFRGRVWEAMFLNNFVCFSTSIVRRAVLDVVGPFDESLPLAIDYDLWLRCARRFRFDYIDEPLVKYRTGHANLSQRAEERLLVALGIMRRQLEPPNPGEPFAASVVKRGFAETYANLGLIARGRSRAAAIRYYATALCYQPLRLKTWKDLLSVFLSESTRRHLRRVLGQPVDWRTRQPRRATGY